MITKQEFKQLKEYTPLTDAIKNLRDITTKHAVSFTCDLNQIKQEFKANLFSQLLHVDKGLKARYSMMRTEQAKKQLLDQEVISLEGYEEIDELKEAITIYVNAFKSCSVSVVYEALSFTNPQHFIDVYKCSLDKAFENKVIDLEDTPIYKEIESITESIIKLKELGFFDQYNYSNQTIFRELHTIIKLPIYEPATGKPELCIKTLQDFVSAKEFRKRDSEEAIRRTQIAKAKEAEAEAKRLATEKGE